jgi:hypothetical protein
MVNYDPIKLAAYNYLWRREMRNSIDVFVANCCTTDEVYSATKEAKKQAKDKAYKEIFNQ